MNRDPEPPDWTRRPEIWVAAFTFLVRMWFLSGFVSSIFFVPIANGNDRALYDGLARKFAEGQIIPPGVFEYMPLYPGCLGVLYAVLGPNLYIAGFAGALLDTATTFLIVSLARRLGASVPIAAGAGALFALYPMAIIYSALTMPNTLNAFLLMTFVYLGVSQESDSPWWRWLGLGLLAGVTSLGFAGMLLIVAAATIYWSVYRFRAKRWNPLPQLLFLGGTFLPILPATLHNWNAEQRFVLVTAHGGFNFYMGNNPDATGYPIQIADFRGDAGSLLVDARAQAEEVMGRKLKAAEFSAYWSDRAWKFIREQPLAELNLFRAKFLRFWNHKEYDDLRTLPMFQLTGEGFTSPLWPGFGWIAFLGFVGLCLSPRGGLVKIVFLAGFLGVLSFFITARYRLTFAPLLCTLGALGLQATWAMIRGQAASVTLKVLTSLLYLTAAVLVAYPLRGSDFRSLDRLNTAAYLVACKRPDAALAVAFDGLRISPREPLLHFVMGNALMALKRPDEAAGAYRAVLQLRPDDAPAHFNLAQACMELGNHPMAAEEAWQALRCDLQHPHAPDVLDEALSKLTAKKRGEMAAVHFGFAQARYGNLSPAEHADLLQGRHLAMQVGKVKDVELAGEQALLALKFDFFHKGARELLDKVEKELEGAKADAPIKNLRERAFRRHRQYGPDTAP